MNLGFKQSKICFHTYNCAKSHLKRVSNVRKGVWERMRMNLESSVEEMSSKQETLQKDVAKRRCKRNTWFRYEN